MNPVLSRVLKFSAENQTPRPTIWSSRQSDYPKIIGTMIYIAITALPDIAYAVGKLSRRMHQPNKLHCDMLKDVVGYHVTAAAVGVC